MRLCRETQSATASASATVVIASTTTVVVAESRGGPITVTNSDSTPAFLIRILADVLEHLAAGDPR